MRRFVSAFLLPFAFLAGCASPYATPVIEEGLPFRGVADYLDKKAPVRLVLTHGMCSGTHLATGSVDDTNWVARRAGQVAAALGQPFDPDQPPAERTVYPADGEALGMPVVERYVHEFDTDAGAVEVNLLVWGRHMDAYRANLDYDSTRGGGGPGEAPVRASLNQTLRAQLMNDCLIDAVVYLGPNGDPVREGMRLALCDILGGEVPRTAAAVARRGSTRCPNATGFGGPAVLAPESLGSTILFEAFNDIESAAAQAGAPDIRSIFLASNQLPLLLQGSVPDPAEVGIATRDTADAGGNSLSTFLNLVAPAGPRLLGGESVPLELVAITDPNDVFGYRISPEILGRDDIALRNVLVSNTPTFLGVIADPIAAHRNTGRSQVFDLITLGSP